MLLLLLRRLAFGDGQEVLDELRHITHSLPKPNYALYKYLIMFLVQVANHSEKNKMHVNNLLRVITPTLGCIPGFISLPMAHFDFFFNGNFHRLFVCLFWLFVSVLINIRTYFFLFYSISLFIYLSI